MRSRKCQKGKKNEFGCGYLQDVLPFACCGINPFAPLSIRDFVKGLKKCHYVNCFSDRATHLEIANSLETDTSALALIRFIGRRRKIQQMRSENGSNFVNVIRELIKFFQEINYKWIQQYLQSVITDWFTWVRNPPTARSQGGRLVMPD